MPEIRTLTGSIQPEALGFTNSHAHLVMDRDLILSKHPDFKLDDLDKICQEVELFKAAGGAALVEMSCIGVGRSPRKMLEIARRTSLNVIASTGLQHEGDYQDSHWRYFYTAEQIAKIFIEEIELGLDGFNYTGPLIDRLPAKAGVIKFGTHYQVITANQRKVIEAAALAHLQTGAPIATHTENGTMGFEQVELLISHGVKPEHVVVGHMDRNPDFYVHRQVAETGAYLCYDTPGRVKYFPETTFINLLRQMAEAGYSAQILWGGDVARRSYFVSYGGGPGLAYVPGKFLPRLRAEGFDEALIRQIFVENPARAFSFADHR